MKGQRVKTGRNLSVRQISFYKSLSKLKPAELSHVISHLDDSGVDSLCECVYNIIYTDLKLDKPKKSKLRKHLRQHCCLKNIKIITNKHHSTIRRRKALQQEGRGISLLLSTLTPILTSLLGSLVG
jgi:hypothetical protein